LYEGLKKYYEVFLDSEAKFRISDLQDIVKNTEVFIFVLTNGIPLSEWCLKELLVAVQHHKKVPSSFNIINHLKIIVVRDLAYTLPGKLPPEWECVEHILRSPNQLVWIAEYNSVCLQALRKQIGPSDFAIQKAKEQLEEARFKNQLDQGELDLWSNFEGVSAYKLFGPPLKKISLHGVHSLDIPMFEDLLENQSALESLDLAFNAWQKADIDEIHATLQSSIIGKYCGNLQRLSLNWEELEDSDIIAIFEGLHHIPPHIEIAFGNKITDRGWKCLFARCNNLKDLTIASNRNSKAWLKYIPERCKNIERLRLNHSAVTDNGIKNISEECHQLQNIGLSHCDQITDIGLKHLSEGCHKLQQIELNECSQITDVGLKNLSEGCHELQQISLSRVNLTDVGLKYLSQGCHQLQKIGLSYCDQITDMGLKNLSEGCHELQKISLSRVNVTDAGFKYLSEGCPNLMDVESTTITDKGLQYLSEGCSKLCILKISDCNITDLGLKYVAQQCLNIHTLEIDDCQEITDQAVKFLAEGCQQLQAINLSKCSRITDESLRFLSECKQLQRVDIRGSEERYGYRERYYEEEEETPTISVSKISDKGLMYLAGCVNLKSITVAGYSGVTGYFIQAFPSGTEISMYA
jgi:F-box/leucine-rich repeat protein 2/20